MTVSPGYTSPPPRIGDGSHRAGWWWAAAGFAAVMALLGLATPKIALPVAIIAALGLTVLLLGHALARLLSTLRAAPRSAFAPKQYERPPQLLPQHIARMVPDETTKNPILSPGARSAIVTVTTERLWAHRGLNLHQPDHHAVIEGVVSPALWGVIRPDVFDKNHRVVPRPVFFHSGLDRVLDEIERL